MQAQDQPGLHTKICLRKKENQDRPVFTLAQLLQSGMAVCHWAWSLPSHHPQSFQQLFTILSPVAPCCKPPGGGGGALWSQQQSWGLWPDSADSLCIPS